MKGIAKSQELELARRKKISEARKRKKELLGFINSEETRGKIAKAHKGKVLSKEHKIKIGLGNIGKHGKPEEWIIKKANEASRLLTGEKSHNWRGDEVGYGALHTWVSKTLGKPKRCDNCKIKNAKRYEWSNISRKYKRDVSDWERLCVSCHRKKGFTNGEYSIPWKGKKVYMNTGRTWIKKGQHLSPATEFKAKLIIKET